MLSWLTSSFDFEYLTSICQHFHLFLLIYFYTSVHTAPLFFSQDNSSKWAEAVEKAMGRMLSAFIVTNTEDQNTLMNILRRLKCDTSHTVVCQGNDPPYVVQSIPNAHTVCDAITVENPKVFNCLIDQTKMEQTILVQDEEDCNRYFGRNNGLDGFNDHRIKAALTARGTRIEFRFGNQVSAFKSWSDTFLLIQWLTPTLLGLCAV